MLSVDIKAPLSLLRPHLEPYFAVGPHLDMHSTLIGQSPVRPLTAFRNSANAKEAASDSDASDAAPPSGALKFLSGRPRKRRRVSLVPTPQTPAADSSESEHSSAAAERRDAARRRRRHSLAVLEFDTSARQRCFDYLLSAIDAIWAEYCDSTSAAESQLYLPQSPVSEASSASSEENAGSSSHHVAISSQPESQRLMRMKQRLLDAKYKLTDLAGKCDPDASSQFWKYWDALRYTLVEIVDGEDEDEATDVLEDLEAGRFYPVY